MVTTVLGSGDKRSVTALVLMIHIRVIIQQKGYNISMSYGMKKSSVTIYDKKYLFGTKDVRRKVKNMKNNK